MSDMCSFFAFKCWDSLRLLFLVLVASFLALVLVLVLLRRHTTPRRLLPLPSRVGNVCEVVGDSEVQENW